MCFNYSDWCERFYDLKSKDLLVWMLNYHPGDPSSQPLKAPRWTQPFIILRSLKWVPRTPGDFSKLLFVVALQPWGSWILFMKRRHKVCCFYKFRITSSVFLTQTISCRRESCIIDFTSAKTEFASAIFKKLYFSKYSMKRCCKQITSIQNFAWPYK